MIPPFTFRGAPRVNSTSTFAPGPASAPRNARAVGPSSIADASGSPDSFRAIFAKALRTTR